MAQPGSSAALLKYAEALRLGGNPRSKRLTRLRRRAFPNGPTPMLAAMHAELVDPRWRGPQKRAAKRSNRPAQRPPASDPATFVSARLREREREIMQNFKGSARRAGT